MLTTALKVAKSFLPTENHKKTPPQTCIPVKMKRQWTHFSCTAAVLQMVAHHYGIKMGHIEAITLTGCTMDGAALTAIADVLKESGLKTRHVTSSGVRRALQRGQPVISHDAVSYQSDHAILVIGQTPKGFWIADPLVAEMRWEKEARFLQMSEEWIAVKE